MAKKKDTKLPSVPAGKKRFCAMVYSPPGMNPLCIWHVCDDWMLEKSDGMVFPVLMFIDNEEAIAAYRSWEWVKTA